MPVEFFPSNVCVHCGRVCGDMAGGSGGVGEYKLCHPNEPGRPDCYHLVTVYHHELVNCTRCRQEPWQPLTAAEVHDAFMTNLTHLEAMVQDIRILWG